MSRERLMAQQRARAQAAAAARKAKQTATNKRLTGGVDAKTGEEAATALKKHLKVGSKSTPSTSKGEKNVGPTIIRNGKLHRWNGSKYVVDTKGGLSTQARRKVSSTSPTTPPKAKPTKKAPVPAGKVPAPKAKPPTSTAKPPTPKAKPSKSKAKPNGGGLTKTDDGTSRRSKSYAGVLPGTPEKKEKKTTTRRSSRRGAAARRNRANSTPTTPTLSEKRIKVGKQTVTMVYNGSKWVRKK